MKRFTETTKWDDPWFMDLPIKYKLFWLYLCDRCDNAGAWEPNMRLVAAHVGEPFELVEVLRVFAGRLSQLEGGKLFITKFIPFQYGNLSPNCRAHIPILNAVEKLRVSKGYPKGIHTLMEMDTEKEKDSVQTGGEWHETVKLLSKTTLKRFEEWIAVRKSMGKKPKSWEKMFAEQIRWLSKYSEPIQLEIISASIRNNWQGLFEPKQSRNGARNDTPKKVDPSKIDLPERFKSWAATNYPDKREAVMKWQTWADVPSSLRQQWWREEKEKLPVDV